MCSLRNLLALLVVVALAGVVSAQTTQPAATQVKGRITKINSDGTTVQSIVVKNRTGEVTVKVTDKTLVVVDSQNATLSDLKVDQRVTVTEDQDTATKIEARTRKANQ